MGGHEAGRRASFLACSAIAEASQGLGQGVGFEALRRAVDQRLTELHQRFVSSGSGKERGRGHMGTTITGLFVGSQVAAIVHAGDSRLYRFRDSLLVQLTQDHSLRAVTGDLSISRNLLSNAIGGGGAVHLEWIDLTGRILEGDRYLLCTDGLWESLEERYLESVLMGQDPGKVADDLLSAALEAGGQDNISCLVCDVVSPSAEAPGYRPPGMLDGMAASDNHR